jgi:nitrogen fixation protein NifU and related proteins
MADDFDNFVEDLQNRIFDEARTVYGEIAFQRWLNPLYMGTIEDANGYGRVTGTCGDTMEIFLKIEEERVKEATFRTDGCGSSTVCGSFAAELSLGKNPDGVVKISGEIILKILGGLPEEDRHCAFLAAETLQVALDDYFRKELQKK